MVIDRVLPPRIIATYDFLWLKQCRFLPPMTGNGKHAIYLWWFSWGTVGEWHAGCGPLMIFPSLPWELSHDIWRFPMVSQNAGEPQSSSISSWDVPLETNHFFGGTPPFMEPPYIFPWKIYILSGWWFEPLWRILVNWDDYSQYMGKQKMFQTTNQSISHDIYIFPLFL